MSDPESFQFIKQIFDRRFEHWEIVLPVESQADRPRGTIFAKGWKINYQFGTEAGVLYLEYFASNRMTNDSLHRIYADGREVRVGESAEFYIAGDEASKQAYYEHNRRFYEDVRRRGLEGSPK